MDKKLSERQYQIGDLKFGRGTNIEIVGMDQVGYQVQPGDYPLPMSDEIRHRRDYIQPGQIQFSLAVLDNHILPGMAAYAPPGISLSSESSGKTGLELLKAEWRADEVRSQWGWVKPLRYHNAGETRVLYGRPRDIATDTLKKRPGWYTATLVYQLSDSLSYDDKIQLRTVSPGAPVAISRIDPDLSGGGMAPSWLKMTLIGPAVDPVIVFGPRVIQFSGTIQAGKSVEFNGTPWERRAVNSDGLNVGTSLIGDSCYLEDLRFPAKKTWNFQLSAGGTTGSTLLLVQWQEAFHAV